MSAVAADAESVADVIARLGIMGLRCALFGGWAEEARGLRPPGPHRDIDLLLFASDFGGYDRLMADSRTGFFDIDAKRFAHKRAFRIAGSMVELVLVRSVDERPCTWFWGDVRFDWFSPLATLCRLHGRSLPVVTSRNLRHFRNAFDRTEPWRWKQPGAR